MVENVKNEPSIRFSEFTGEWLIKPLSEVSEIGRGKSRHRPRDAEFLYGGSYPFIQTGDIKAANLYLDNYSQTYSEEGLKQSKLWNKGTLCVTIAANIAETAILNIQACFPDSIIGLTAKSNQTTSVFLKYQFDKFKIEIQKMSQGIAQANLNQEKLGALEFSFPSLPEQQKIASFLSAVDDKIQQLSKKKALLDQYKKGVMQQLFSQKLRFKDDQGNAFPDWEEKTLGSISEKKSSNISASSLEGNHGNYIIYGATGVLKKVDFYREEHAYVSIVKDGAGVGRVLICEPKSSVLGTLDIIVNKPDVNLYFLYLCIENIEFTKYIAGSTIPHIYFRDYSKELLAVPCFEEQTKIANFLSAIDDKINSVNQQIEHTRQFKKGLLQQMFV